MSDILSWLVPGLAIGSGLYGAVQNNASARTQASALRDAAAQQAAALERATAAQNAALQLAAETQQRSGDNAINFLRYAYDQSRADTAPWRQAGGAALAAAVPQFTGSFEESPGYRFAFDEGLRAIQHGMAGRGLLNSTAAGRALARYGAGAASQEYNNYANRLMQLAGLGQGAAGQGAAAAQGFGSSAAGVATGMGSLLAGLQGQYGQNLASMTTSTGNALAQLTAGQGAAMAQGANAGANALMGGANALLGYWAQTNNPLSQWAAANMQRRMPAQ